jgi:hypothetical protein
VAFVSDVSDGNTCPEIITRTYSVTDACLGQTLVTQTITVLDITAPTATAPKTIKVYPRAWQHDWIQKHLAAQIAKNAQTVKPTEDDLAIASMRYAEVQRAADEEYERTQNVPQVNSRWVRRT